MTDRPTASDASYHRRHSRRSQRRAECIAAHITGPSTVLDVGCNEGITSRHLLETGKAVHITGIELLGDTVSRSLKSDPRFSLVEGDISQVKLEQRFDVCIYGAVHHHVLNRYGLSAAVSVLQKLASCCNKVLFFETGQLIEGGRWPWQHAMYRYFRTDEAHLHYLLGSIEHFVADFQVLTRFWIHGIRRWFVKIDMLEPERREVETQPKDVVLLQSDITATYGRTVGSNKQQLVSFDAKEARDSPTWFGVAEGADGQRLFLKRYLHSPSAALREYRINQQIPHGWAVKCLGFADDASTLAFPFLKHSRNVMLVAGDSRSNRQLAAEMVLRVFRDARETIVQTERHLLLPASAKESLLQICDFNPNNLLVVDDYASIKISVVDFEQQGCRYLWRNRLHLAHILFTLRQHRVRATIEYLLGLVWMLQLLVQYQFLPVKRRIQDRQPAFLSVMITEIRTSSGKVTAWFLRALGYDELR